MERIELSVLRELCRGDGKAPFPTSVKSLRQIAKTLHTNKETVRMRLQRLKTNKVLDCWLCAINPNLLSLNVAHVWMELSNENFKARVYKEIVAMKNVRMIGNHFGPSLSFVCAYHNSKSLDEELRRITSGNQAKISAITTIMFPQVVEKLTERDLKIYKSIRNRFQKPRTEIANEARLSTRTVTRRLQSLLEKNALFLIPAYNPKKIDGVVAEMVVQHREHESTLAAIKSIEEETEDCLLYVERHIEPSASFVFIASNLRRIREILKYAKKQRGVKFAKVYLIEDISRVRKRMELQI